MMMIIAKGLVGCQTEELPYTTGLLYLMLFILLKSSDFF